MTNFESGEKLLKEAEECLEEMVLAYQRKSWNLVIRRAQEVVELGLKGLLKMMGIEYPKVHDPSEYLFQILEATGIEIEETTREQIKGISASLAAKRAPAFYLEREYSKEEASEAIKEAEFVRGFVKEIQRRLR